MGDMTVLESSPTVKNIESIAIALSPDVPLRNLESFGIKSLGRGEDKPSEEMFRKIGFLDPQESVKKIDSITHTILGNNKDFGEGWRRGGAESFYNILRVVTSAGEEKFLALKAIHSMGVIDSKVISEALRLALLHDIDRAPRVYAIAPAMLIREFMPEDSVPLSKDQLMQDANLLLKDMSELGIGTLSSATPINGILAAAVQHNKRLYIIDAGSGDFNGPVK